MRFSNGSIIITDPCYLMKTSDDWDECDYGQCMDRLPGISRDNYWVNFTGIGDGSWKIVDKKSKKTLGYFSADSGQVGVFLLDEVLSYNPNFLTKYPRMDRLATIIEDFKGDVDFYYDGKGSNYAMLIEGNGTSKGQKISFMVDPNLLDYSD